MWKQTLPRTKRGQDPAPKLSSFLLSNIQHRKQNSKYFSQFLYCLLPGLRLHTARTEISKDNLLSPHSGHTYSGYIWHDSKGSRYVTRYYSHSKSRSPAFQTCPQLLAIPAPLPPTVNIMGIGRWLYTITNTL